MKAGLQKLVERVHGFKLCEIHLQIKESKSKSKSKPPILKNKKIFVDMRLILRQIGRPAERKFTKKCMRSTNLEKHLHRGGDENHRVKRFNHLLICQI